MTYIFLIALSLTTHHIITMDTPSFVKTTADTPAKAVATQTNNNNAALDEIVANIDKKINEKYLSSSLFEQLSITTKTEENYFNIIAAPKQVYPTITFNENLLDKLYVKNSIFAQAIDYFVYHAQENFKNVIPITLNSVNNPEASQPIPHFNSFDQSIKKYILQRASNQIEHEYTIKIAPGAPVIDFDICPETDTVAISTGDKQTSYRLRLWNLKTADRLHTFEEDNPVNFVCFNAPGNQLATLVAIAGKTKIKIWNPQSKQLLHTIDPDPGYNPDALAYNNHQTNYLLHAINPWYYPEIWLINTEQCIPCGFTEIPMDDAPQKSVVYRGNYRAVQPKETSLVDRGMIATGLKALTLDIVKRNCSDLYLCEQAIKKAQTKQSLNLITQSNPCKSATSYEQNIIRTSVEAKRKQLTS